MNDHEIDTSNVEDEKPEEPDVHALEFSMKHTDAELRQSLQHYSLRSGGTNLLKCIICSGLYPRYGVLDQHNSYRIGADVIVHSKPMPFVQLHPNSTLGQEPEILGHQLGGAAMDESPLHQLIFYTTLLETNKPFLINSLRVPALHSVLLVARSIHTNVDCSRLVVDRWLDIRSTDAASMQLLLFTCVKIRRMLAESLARKLAGDLFSSSDILKHVLDYYHTEIAFSVKQLHKIDLGSIFVGPGSPSDDASRLPSSFREQFPGSLPADPDTGGIMLTDFLTYGSLVDESLSKVETDHYLITAWTCPHCSVEFHFSPVERMDHVTSCQPKNEEKIDGDKELKTGGRVYFCQECDVELNLTPIEILKHKRTHV